ncbi:MAG: hypothetical protein WC760_00030 [Bacteroidia bacterium]
MAALPEAFVNSIQRLIPQEFEAFLAALRMDVPVSVRLNPLKRVNVFEGAEIIPWCAEGRYLPERPSFIADPLFHAGAYYVQEASSMFLQTAFDTIKNNLPAHAVVLDLCAAPGGKSTLLASALPDDALLVSNEVIRSRVKILTENMQRWGNNNAIITQNDPNSFAKLKNVFDLMLVDAPCSGEGMFRKNKLASDEWSEDAVEMCALRQKRILGDVLNALKPGGYLFYSTCTYNHTENEENLLWLQHEFDLEPCIIPVDRLWGIEEVTLYKGESLAAYRFYPHKTKGEGFFFSCLRKPHTDTTEGARRMDFNFVHRDVQALLSPWMNPEFKVEYLQSGSVFYAVPTAQAALIQHLQKHLNVVEPGVKMGELIRKDLIPDHALALNQLCSKTIPELDLTIKEARTYLKKDQLSVNPLPSPGWNKVTFQGLALGWVKVLPNRINNYFPTHLRVLKDIHA